jgi:hypothetical protein
MTVYVLSRLLLCAAWLVAQICLESSDKGAQRYGGYTLATIRLKVLSMYSSLAGSRSEALCDTECTCCGVTAAVTCCGVTAAVTCCGVTAAVTCCGVTAAVTLQNAQGLGMHG